MRKSLAIKVLLIILLSLRGFPGAEAQEKKKRIQVGFKAMLVSTAFPAFDRTLTQQGWGQNTLEKKLAEALPYLEISGRLDARYFAIARIKQIDYWAVNIFFGDKKDALLARVLLQLLIYDTKKQQELLRETFYGYTALDKSQESEEIPLTLLKEAFARSVLQCANKVAQRLPQMGTVQRLEGDKFSIDLGQNDDLQEGALLELLDESQKSLGLVKVFQVMPEECTAYPKGSVREMKSDLSVRVVRPYEPELEEGELEKKVLREAVGKVFEFQKIAISPNPVQTLEVEMRKARVIMGSKPTIVLEAKGRDHWGDKIDMPGLEWKAPVGAADMLEGQVFRPIRPGAFPIHAKAGDKETEVLIEVVEVKDLALAPGHTVIPWNEKMVQFKCQGRLNESESLEANAMDLDWSVEPSGSAKISGTGLFTSGVKPGAYEVIVELRRDPKLSETVRRVRKQAQVVVIPPVKINLLAKGEAIPAGQILRVPPGSSLQLGYQIACQEPTFDPNTVSLSWSVEPREVGQIDNEGFFQAAETPLNKPGKIIAQIADAHPDHFPDFRGVQSVIRVQVEIQPLETLKILTPDNKARYYLGETINFEVKGYYQGGAESASRAFEVDAPGYSLASSRVGNVYFLNPTQVGPIHVYAKDALSGKIARLELSVEEKPKGVQRVELFTEGFQSEVRPGYALPCIAKAYSGEEEVPGVPLQWSVIPPADHQIDPGGLFHAGQALGTYTVMAKHEASGQFGACQMPIKLEPVVALEIAAPDTLPVDARYPLACKVIGPQGIRLYDRKVQWRATGAGSISEDGLLRAEKPGRIYILAQIDEITKSAILTVTPSSAQSVAETPSSTQPPQVTRLEIRPMQEKRVFAPGETMQFLCTVYSGEEVLSGVPLQWSVDGGAYMIDQQGLFRADEKKVGYSYIITATEPVSDQTAIYKIFIRYEPMAQVKLMLPRQSIEVGDGLPILWQALDKQGKPIPPNKVGKIFFQADGGTIDENKWYKAGDQPGSYVIRAKDESGQITANVSIKIRPKAAPPSVATLSLTQIIVTPESQTLAPGESCQFQVKGYRDKARQWVSEGLQVAWSILPEGSDHTIEATGRFRAAQKNGSYQVQATVSLPAGQSLVSTAKVVIAPKPVQIVVWPTFMRLSPGQKQFLAARVLDTQGQNMPMPTVPIRWSVTGDNQLASAKNDLFPMSELTCGAQLGIYTVKAVLESGLTGTAEIEVVPPQLAEALVEERNTQLGLSYKMHSRWLKMDSSKPDLPMIHYIADNLDGTSMILLSFSLPMAFEEKHWPFVISHLEENYFPQGGFQRLPEEKRLLAQLPGKCLGYTSQKKQKNVLFGEVLVEVNDTIYVIPHGQRIYLVETSCLQQQKTLYEPLFETVITSLKLIPQTTGEPTAQLSVATQGEATPAQPPLASAGQTTETETPGEAQPPASQPLTMKDLTRMARAGRGLRFFQKQIEAQGVSLTQEEYERLQERGVDPEVLRIIRKAMKAPAATAQPTPGEATPPEAPKPLRARDLMKMQQQDLPIREIAKRLESRGVAISRAEFEELRNDGLDPELLRLVRKAMLSQSASAQPTPGEATPPETPKPLRARDLMKMQQQDLPIREIAKRLESQGVAISKSEFEELRNDGLDPQLLRLVRKAMKSREATERETEEEGQPPVESAEDQLTKEQILRLYWDGKSASEMKKKIEAQGVSLTPKEFAQLELEGVYPPVLKAIKQAIEKARRKEGE